MRKLNILVIGLKTFGQSIVKQLYEYNCDVLAIDKNMERVEEVAEYATEAIQLDIKDSTEVKKLPLGNFDVAVITMKDLGPNIMATMLCEEAGIKKIIARSTSNLHRKILEKIGVDNIISPDTEMGIRIAKGIMDTGVMETINISTDYDITEIKVEKRWIGKSLRDLEFRNNYGMNVLLVRKLNSKVEISPNGDYTIEEGDRLVVINDKNINE
jgi:trk system potassium uptake protein TrkA